MITDSDIAIAQRVLDQCISTTEAARILKIDASNVVRQGGLRSLVSPLHGSARLWLRSDVERLAESRKVSHEYQLTLEQVSLLLGKTPRVVKRLDVELAPIIVHRGDDERRLYRREVIAAYLADHADDPTADFAVEACPPSNRNKPVPRVHVRADRQSHSQEVTERVRTLAVNRADRRLRGDK